jgi:colanic acid biosynthesis glycosyl transferase WcaI
VECCGGQSRSLSETTGFEAGSVRILFINCVYPPASGATGLLLSELVPILGEQGYDVTVVATKADRHSASSETVRGVRIERVTALPFRGRAIWLRAFAYLALYPALFWRALRLPPSDVLVTMTDPPLLLLFGPIIAFFKGSRLIHWAQDIYPEVAEELGVLRNHGCIANICRALSTAALRKQSRIVAVGRCMKERLLARGLPERAIEVISNWAPNSISSEDANGVAQFRRLHDLENKFVVMYSGNLGLAHSFHEILEAARALQPKRADIVFLMVGDGPRLAQLKTKAAELSLSNVRFLPSQPFETLSAVLKAADVHLVTMVPETCGLVVPSKLYGIFAAGRPCLFVGPQQSEAALLIREYECGSVVSCGAELASAIIHWSDHPDLLNAAGLRAQRAATNFTADVAATEFSRLLQLSTRPVPFSPSLNSSPAKAA